MGTVVHTFVPGTQESEAARSLLVWSQPCLHSKFWENQGYIVRSFLKIKDFEGSGTISFLVRQWWCMPLIPALGRQRQADLSEFQGLPGVQSNFQDSQDWLLHRETLSWKAKQINKQTKSNKIPFVFLVFFISLY